MPDTRTLTATLLLAFSASLTAQSWELAPGARPAGRIFPALAYDSVRSEMILFGGMSDAGVWIWDGDDWRRHFGAGPSARFETAMVYDPVRDRVVLFGGSTFAGGAFAPVYGDTWEWDGSQWTERTFATAPLPRSNHTLVFDDVRNVVLLYGGRGASGAERGDLWQFDGTAWTELTPAVSPPARAEHGAAFDSVRGRMVVAGGDEDDDTWEWDGSQWHAVPGAFPYIARGKLAYDVAADRVVALAPASGFASTSATYRLDAGQWVEIPTPEPVLRIQHALVYDPTLGRVLAVAGALAPAPTAVFPIHRTSSIDSFDGSDWVPVTTEPAIGFFSQFGLHPDADQLVVFDGRGALDDPTGPDTWVRTGGAWSRPDLAVQPPGRTEASMAYDRAREQLVMFGGSNAPFVTFDDTWTWDGSAWSQETPSQRPTGRRGPAMAYDEARETIVLFGGRPGFGDAFTDTWEWDGSEWTEVTPVPSPPSASWSRMVYDSVRDCIVLVGFAGSPFVWEFEAGAWSNRSSFPAPQLSAQARQVSFDPVRGLTLLVVSGVTWGWDGSSWSVVDTDAPVTISRLFFDERRAVTEGMVDGSESWWFATDVPPAALPYGPDACGPAALSSAVLTFPTLGSVARFELTGSQPLWPGTLLVGESNTGLFGMELPVALDPLGLPGCSIVQSSNVTLAAPSDAFGVTEFAFPIPDDVYFLGTRVFLQGVTIAPSLNALGLSFSRGLDVTVGQ